MRRPDRWHIASYPRSGNHLVRLIIEASSGRPTAGCMGTKNDMPIHERAPNRADVIRITNREPIGFKAHSVREIHRRDADMSGDPLGLLLITRDPADAIATQATWILSNRRKYPILTDRRIRLVIQEQVNLYLSLVFRYAAQSHSGRIWVRFEDLIAADTRSAAVAALLGQVGLNAPAQDLDRLFQLAKASQVSIGAKGQRLRARIAEQVRDQLSYGDVEKYLIG